MSEARVALGQRLQAAREKKGLSAQKAADDLHLDGWVVEGLEGGNYERIGPTVYAKGHLKRYAELLGLPVAEVLAGFDGEPPVPEPQPQPASMRMRTSAGTGRETPWPSIAGVVIFALVVAGIYWWRPWHPRTAMTAPAAHASAAVPGDTANGDAAAGGADARAMSSVQSAGGTSASQAAAPGTTPSSASGERIPPSPLQGAADTRAGSGRARLRLSFLGDSWVDVHDALGQRLFAGTGHANNVRSMAGEAPFRIYLKSANAIRLEINNHVVAIAPQYVVANAAHFEAGADGVLRRDLRTAPAIGDVKPPPASTAAPAGSRPHG